MKGNQVKRAGVMALLGASVMFAVMMKGNMTVHAGQNYYVAVTGSDSNAGTETAPFRTIQKAADEAAAGSIVYIKEGTYYERVYIGSSGSAEGGYITLQNYGTDQVIIDGTGTSPEDQEALIYMENQSYIKIKGLIISNNICNSTTLFPKGIEVNGYGSHIEFSDLTIHDIKNTNATLDSGANGIGIYGTHADNPIAHVTISNVEIYGCVLGQSETLTLNGNVDTFTIDRCYIHDNDNIGICLIGYEETCPKAVNDQARNGIISGNTVVNCSSAANPTYTDPCAGGIYSDGSRDNIISGNTITGCDIGIEAGAEHPETISSNITIKDNVIYNNRASGIGIGGYDTDLGWTTDSKILNNTLYRNDTDNGYGREIDIAKGYNNIVQGNVIYSNSGNEFIGNSFSSQYSYNIALDYNEYYRYPGTESAVWEWQQTEYSDFAEYTEAAGQDTHSIYGEADNVRPAVLPKN